MKKSLLYVAALFVLVALASAAWLYWEAYAARMKKLDADLVQASRCQSLVLFPALRRYHLENPPRDTEINLQDFLKTQVGRGALTDTDARQILKDIAAYNQGMPVFTKRGWMLPIVADGYRLSAQ